VGVKRGRQRRARAAPRVYFATRPGVGRPRRGRTRKTGEVRTRVSPPRGRERATPPLLRDRVTPAKSVRAPAKSTSGAGRSRFVHGSRADAAPALRLSLHVDAAGAGTLLRKGRSLPQRRRSPALLPSNASVAVPRAPPEHSYGLPRSTARRRARRDTPAVGADSGRSGARGKSRVLGQFEFSWRIGDAWFLAAVF
jgi:hypothetical protein